MVNYDDLTYEEQVRAYDDDNVLEESTCYTKEDSFVAMSRHFSRKGRIAIDGVLEGIYIIDELVHSDLVEKTSSCDTMHELSIKFRETKVGCNRADLYFAESISHLEETLNEKNAMIETLERTLLEKAASIEALEEKLNDYLIYNYIENLHTNQ